MELVVSGVFGTVPEEPKALQEAFIEAEWLETWRAELLASVILRCLSPRS
jgi:hypothetical protein